MRMKNEEDLIQEVLQGNQISFELLIRPYSQGILNMAYQLTGDIEEAKDTCQEAICKLFKYLKKFRRGTNFKSWLFKIVVNASYDTLKRRKRHKRIIENKKNITFDKSSDPEKCFLDKEIKEKIKDCLHLLSPKEKTIFLLRDVEGFSIVETSKILECSSMNIRTHLSRARRKIKAEFEKIYFEKRGKE